jgi:hypothetical protein
VKTYLAACSPTGGAPTASQVSVTALAGFAAASTMTNTACGTWVSGLATLYSNCMQAFAAAAGVWQQATIPLALRYPCFNVTAGTCPAACQTSLDMLYSACRSNDAVSR